MQVEPPGFITEVLLQDPRGSHRFGNHGTAGDDGEVFTLVAVCGFQFGLEGIDEIHRLAPQADYVGFAEDEGCFFVGYDRRGFAGETDVLRADVFEQQVVGGLAGLDYVARDDHGHIGQSAHGEQIFQRLVRSAVGAYTDAAVGSGNQDVEVAIADRGADLIQIAGGGEGRVRAEDREFPFFRQASGGRGGGLLGYPHADPAILALGFARIKFADSDRTRNVQAKADHARIVAVRGQRLPEPEARRLHVDFHIFGGVPPVIAVKLGHLGIEFALDLGLVLPGVSEELLNRNLAFDTEFLQGLV